ncbi:MAG: hypothetical protein KDK71_06740, partial [Chlamydiia bacterium]|nr:hypothetical protein [Chlamydiia bacterium]
MRKKTVIIFASLFAFLMAIGIGHHQVVCFGVKTYLRGHLPKGEKVTFDYGSMRWEEGKLALQQVVVKQKGRAPLEMGIDELKVAFELELFPFKWSQKIEVDRPLIILEKGVFDQSTKKKSLYQALDKALFRSSMQIREGELLIGNIPKEVQNLFGYQRAAFSFSSLDKEGEGQLVITKKGEEQGALVRFRKEGQLLALDLEFLQCDAMWAFSIGRMF